MQAYAAASVAQVNYLEKHPSNKESFESLNFIDICKECIAFQVQFPDQAVLMNRPKKLLLEMTWAKQLLSWKRVVDSDLEFTSDSASMNIPPLSMGNEGRER